MADNKKMQITVSFANIIFMSCKNDKMIPLSLPPSLVITTTVDPGPAPFGLMTCRETKYWVYVFSSEMTCLKQHLLEFENIISFCIFIPFTAGKKSGNENFPCCWQTIWK